MFTYLKSFLDDETTALVEEEKRLPPYDTFRYSSAVRKEPKPWTYSSPQPSSGLAPVLRLTAPPRPPDASARDAGPCSREALSARNDGIMEKSVIPSIGELIFIPFHSTCVCEEEVPLNDTVDNDARPDCFTKTEEL